MGRPLPGAGPARVSGSARPCHPPLLSLPPVRRALAGRNCRTAVVSKTLCGFSRISSPLGAQFPGLLSVLLHLVSLKMVISSQKP